MREEKKVYNTLKWAQNTAQPKPKKKRKKKREWDSELDQSVSSLSNTCMHKHTNTIDTHTLAHTVLHEPAEQEEEEAETEEYM